MEITDILDLKLENNDFDKNMTIKDYLYKLLITLWRKKDIFNSKRPFESSFWEYDLYTPLIKADVVSGELDEDGYIRKVDKESASVIIERCINTCFGKEGLEERGKING